MDIKDLEMWALTDGRLSSVKVTAEDSANARDLSRLKAPKPGSQAVFFFLDKIRSYFMYKNTLFSSTKQTWTTSVQGHSQRIWRQGSKLYFLGLFAYSFNLFFCIFVLFITAWTGAHRCRCAAEGMSSIAVFCVLWFCGRQDRAAVVSRPQQEEDGARHWWTLFDAHPPKKILLSDSKQTTTSSSVSLNYYNFFFLLI